MLSRAMLLYASQVSRESRRTDSTVIRGLYAAFAFSNLTMVSGLDPPEAGISLLRAMTVVHAAMAVLLAIRLAGDVAGNRASGLVGLLALSGLSASEAVASQLLLAVTSFLSVWVVRVPIVFLAFSLGGTTLPQILQVEALLLGLFVMTLCAGLLLGHYSPDRTTSRMVFLLPAAMDFGLLLPSAIVFAVESWTTINVPPLVEAALDSLRYFRLSSCLFDSMRSPYPSAIYLWPLVLHLGIAWPSLWAWRRVYYTCLDEAEVPATSESTPRPIRPSKSMTRPSRPVWDDALAWQAIHVHSDVRWNIIGRRVLIGVALVGSLVLVSIPDPGYRGTGVAFLVISTLLLMLIGRAKVSDCLQSEIKQKTLPALLLAPQNAIELCDGWGRGAWKLMLPDLVLNAACLVGVLLYSPMELAPGIVGGAILLQASGPFFLLSPLVPYSIRGIASGLGLLTYLFVIIVIAGSLSVGIHPWLGLLVLVPLAWGWNVLCRRMIPKWFAQKQDELV